MDEQQMHDEVIRKLRISPAELNAMYCGSAGGYLGTEVAEEICRRFGCDDAATETFSLGDMLEHTGVLTAPEARWLDGEELEDV